MDNLTIIGLSGKRGSGKGFAALVIKQYYEEKGITVHIFKFSEVLAKILDERNIERTQDNYNQLFLELNSQKPDFMSAILKEKIEESVGVLIVDGIRDPLQAKVVKSHGGIIIYLESDDHDRYQKVIERKEKEGDTELSFEEFMQDEENPANNNIAGLKNTADKVLSNDYTKKFITRIEAEVQKIMQ